MATRFFYRANWIRVENAESVVLNLDLGFHTFRSASFRLRNVSCADTSHAREDLERILMLAGDLRVETHKSPDKWEATIYYTNTSGVEVNLNEAFAAMNVARVLSS